MFRQVDRQIDYIYCRIYKHSTLRYLHKNSTPPPIKKTRNFSSYSIRSKQSRICLFYPPLPTLAPLTISFFAQLSNAISHIHTLLPETITCAVIICIYNSVSIYLYISISLLFPQCIYLYISIFLSFPQCIYLYLFVSSFPSMYLSMYLSLLFPQMLLSKSIIFFFSVSCC